MPRPSAAEAIFGHLPHRSDEPPKQQQPRSLAAAMYPKLAPQVKPRDDWRERDRESLLRNLRELNARLRER